MDDATKDQERRRLEEYRRQFELEWAAVIEPLIDEIDKAKEQPAAAPPEAA